MNALDALLHEQVPTVMVPRYEALAPIRPDSHRYLIAEDGLHLEIDRPWLHGVFKIGDSLQAFPYGPVAPRFDLRLRGSALTQRLAQFIAAARAASPDEHAAWLLFRKDRDGALDYYAPAVLRRSAGHIAYVRPDARPDCLPIIDCHSHGCFNAFISPPYGFSAQDNRDDLKDDLKIAVVVGNLDQPAVSVIARLVGLGLEINISEWVISLLQNDGVLTTTDLP